MQKNNLKFFLAANSCRGFVSEFQSNADLNFKTYIIKGGPGTGKSSFMKKVAAAAQEKGENVILCPCSSDPESLDAVILEKSKIMLLDGTAPHTVDPRYPAVCEEILNFGEFWESDNLKNKQEIIEITNNNKALHKTASRYIQAAGELLWDNYKTAAACCSFKKCESFANKICQKAFSNKGNIPKENVRFLGSLTPKGFVAFPETVTKNYNNIIILEDNFFAASDFILKNIREYALNHNHEIITLKNPFFPELIDHIIIPELSLAIVTENRFISFKSQNRRIHSRRFYDSTLLHQSKNRIKFNRKTADELLQSAYFTLKQAKTVHDELEKHYINAMNFEKLNKFSDMFCKKYI